MSAFKLPDTSQSQLISTAELAKIISYKSQTIRKWLVRTNCLRGYLAQNKSMAAITGYVKMSSIL